LKQVYVLVDIGGNSKVAVFGTDGEKLAMKSMLTLYDKDPDFFFGGSSFDQCNFRRMIQSAAYCPDMP